MISVSPLNMAYQYLHSIIQGKYRLPCLEKFNIPLAFFIIADFIIFKHFKLSLFTGVFLLDKEISLVEI